MPGDSLPALLTLFGAASLIVAFAIRNVVIGDYHDAQVASRGSTPLLGMWFRQCFAWGQGPLVRLLLWLGLPPAAVTTLALLLAIGAGAAFAAGRLSWGTLLFLASGTCDCLDGRLARERRVAGPGGALLDSVVDRYVEVVVFAGLAWYYRGSWVLVPVLAAMAGSSLVPYVRARGEGLGVVFTNVGLVQRPERFAILGTSLLLSPLFEAMTPSARAAVPHRVLAGGIIVVALTTGFSAIQRVRHARRELSLPTTPPPTLVGRGSLLRSALAGAVATAGDFGAVLALVEVVGLHPAVATLVGCALGGAINFSVNRCWTFQLRGPALGTALRYGLVWATSAGLNSGLVFALILPALPYAAVWWPVRALVYLLWNFPLHRDYVFVGSAGAEETAPRRR